MTKAELVDHVTALGDLTRRDGEVIVETLFDSIIDALKSNDKVEVRGFGSFRSQTAQASHGAQSEDGRVGSGSGEAGTVLQAEQRAARPGESRGGEWSDERRSNGASKGKAAHGARGSRGGRTSSAGDVGWGSGTVNVYRALVFLVTPSHA